MSDFLQDIYLELENNFHVVEQVYEGKDARRIFMDGVMAGLAMVAISYEED